MKFTVFMSSLFLASTEFASAKLGTTTTAAASMPSSFEEFQSAIFSQQMNWDNVVNQDGSPLYGTGIYHRHHHRRSLQDGSNDTEGVEFAPCNEIMAEYSLEELKDFLGTIIDATSTPGSFENVIFRGIFFDNVKTGVQVRRVCASCAGMMKTGTESSPLVLPPGVSQEAFDEFCGDDVYGNDKTYTGLLVIPAGANEEGEVSILPGTHLGYMDTHFTTFSGSVPSVTVDYFYLSIAASNGLVVLAPDYMGYGESTTTSYKGYIIKKAYETSIIPLWYKAKDIIQEASSCTAALADSVYISGYSEGGYASIVIGYMMQSLGVDLVAIHTGGAPFAVRENVKVFMNLMLSGDFPRNRVYDYFVLTSSYSSTYSSLPNYDKGQDFLKPEFRDAIIGLATKYTDVGDEFENYEQTLPDIFGNGTGTSVDLLKIIEDRLVESFSQTETGNPCQEWNATMLEENNMELLCQALRENDLVDIVENQMPNDIAIQFCHSKDDEIVPYNGNVPKRVDTDPLYTTVPTAVGSHEDAGFTCVFANWNFAAASPLLANYQVTPLHLEDGCPATDAPTDAPKVAPTEVVENTSDASSFGAYTIGALTLSLLSSMCLMQ